MSERGDELKSEVTHTSTRMFEGLFAEYKDPLYRFALYLTQNREEAEELFQNTWLRVVKYLTKASAVENFQAWAFTITMNLHRDALRKKRLRRVFSLNKIDREDVNPRAEKTIDAILPSGDDGRRIDMRLALEEALALLPVAQRRVFILKEMEGFTHAEIGEMLRIPVGTAKSLLHRAIKRLAKELADFKEDLK